MTRIDSDVVRGGRYQLGHRIAAGGMGTVWEATDQVLGRRVAVKVLSDALAADHRFVERFRREARAAAGLSHPNVAGVFDYGEDDDRPFIVMELIEGETLAERLARHGRLPPEEAARIAAEAAGALEAAHRAGVVHRDVKPGNIMLTARGEVKVMDFGIAAAGWDSRLTATGSTIGTATYVSPEQATGDRATPASDVYSLGVVLYEMLGGRPPFTEGGPIAVASAHVREAPPPLAEVAPWVPSAVAAVCQRALAKDPAARPASAAAFAAMLAHPDNATDPLGDGATAPPASTGTQQLPALGAGPEPTTPFTRPAAPPTGATEVLRGRPARRRHGAAVALAAILIAGIVALLVLLGLNVGGAPSPIPSRGTPPSVPGTVTMPRLRGDSFQTAVGQLVALGWSISDVHVRQVDGPIGKVVTTDPPPGTSVQPGTPVTLLVGTGHGPKDEHKHKGHGGGD